MISIVMIISITACGQSEKTASSGDVSSSITQETNENEQSNGNTPVGEEDVTTGLSDTWIAFQTPDDFGDITEDSDVAIGTRVSGDFSNTATASSELNVCVYFRKNPTKEHYVMELALLEYGDTPATYLSSDAITLKTKVNDSVMESPLTGTAPNGNLYAGIQASDYFADAYFNELYTGLDIRCIVTIGSSKYNFTIESKDFQEVCSDAGFNFAYVGMTPKDAVLKYLEGGWGSSLNEAIDALLNNREYLAKLDDNDLEQIFGHQFFEISSPNAYWNMMNYSSDHQKQQTVYFKDNSWGKSVEVNSYAAKPVEVKDGTIIYNDKVLELRKVIDDIFVVFEIDSATNTVTVERIMILWDDEVTTENALDNMIDTIRTELMPK